MLRKNINVSEYIFQNRIKTEHIINTKSNDNCGDMNASQKKERKENEKTD